MITRSRRNPVITPADVKPSRPDLEVMCAFNPGATEIGGKTLLLMRVAERPVPQKGYVSTAVMDPENPGALRLLHIRQDDPELDAFDPRVFRYKGDLYLTSISHLRIATSNDGERFTVAPAPAMMPETAYETYGIEDPRITFIDGRYWINYSAISLRGVCTALARTRDFRSFERLGVMFCPDNKDIAIFPERVGGRYVAFHRPSMKQIGAPSMWLASSDNLSDWGRHEFIMGPRPGFWDSERVGCGAAPIRTAEGWLEMYHGSDENVRYCLGAVLLDAGNPARVIARSAKPVMEPDAVYEREGFMKNIIFSNALVPRANGKADIYYGAADWVIAKAEMDIAGVLQSLR